MYEGRSLLIYVASGLALSIMSFLVLIFVVYLPMIREAYSPDALTPGVGLFVFFYAQVSCIFGIVAGIPATWLFLVITRRVARHRHPLAFQDDQQ